MTDAYLVPIYPKGHRLFTAYEKNTEYWTKWFGQTRTKQPKGFIEVKVPKL
jgi:hypothetical protein